ncbi:MAG: OsmC family protein [Pyrinomonadaceae bacterium]|nr:OsmC family protein [Pyrinomonadaceae bacterium]
MRRQNISFENSDGETLSAVIEMPVDQKPHSYALFAHCFTCNKNFRAVRSISRALSSAGFGVLSFDFTGLGTSEGEFAETTFSSSVDDLVCAANYLSTNYKAPSLIVGHSLGGSAVILAANVLESIQAVVTIGSPADPEHVKHLFAGGIGEINEAGAATVNIGGRPFTIKKEFVEDVESQNLIDIVGRMRKSFLFMHSPQDRTVGIENAAALYGAAKHPKSFVSLDGADHLLSNADDGIYAGELIASWARRYIQPADIPNLSSKGDVVAFLPSDEKFTTEIMAGGHRFVADEPVGFGGKDFGPSPYHLVASGLAACTVMTLRMYADRKGWFLGDVSCHVSHEKTHREDCGDCDNPKARIDHFKRELEFSGELSEAQTTRLLEIADKCPVHKTLENSSRIETNLVA